MKKRILCIILAVLLVIPTMLLAGCGGKDDNIVNLGDDGKVPLTLTLYSITEEETTEEARQAVEDEINRITEYEFKTHIILRLFTADEYEEKLKADLETAKKNYVEPEEVETDENGETITQPITTPKETLGTTAQEIETDENGETKKVVVMETQAVYPAENGTQVDIFLVNSLDNYNKFVAEGHVQALDGELLGESAIINKYVNPTLMKSVATMTGTYAIPNNKLIGSYEYVLLRKDLVDKYSYDPSNLNTLAKLESYIKDVKSDGVTAVLDTYGISPLSISMTGEDSLFGAYVGYKPMQKNIAMPRNLLENSDFQKEYSLIRNLKADGTLVEGEYDADNKPACVFMKGSSAIEELYGDDYYVSVYKYPTATNENVYNSMYAVGSYTISAARCMQIVTYLQTNKELCNILRYGVRDEHYTFDEETQMVSVIDNCGYSMNPEYCGNMFLTYQNDKMSADELAVSADNWALGKQQNLDSIASPYLTFSPITTDVYFEEEDTMTYYTFADEDPVDEDASEAELEALSIQRRERMMADIIEASDKLEEKLEAFNGTGEELTAYLNTLAKEFNENESFAASSVKSYFDSAFARYIAWHNITYPKTQS